MARGENSFQPTSVGYLSIIIPCLNEEHYIGKLLSCLSRQTFQDFEVVIVDAGSDDDTRGAVERAISHHENLQDKVRFFIADEKGVAYQRNFAVQFAIHDRLLFLDADVQIPPSFLSLTLEEISKKGLVLATAQFKPISRRADDHFVYLHINLRFRPETDESED